MKPTLLIVLAHPDDESFGTGGTAARYAREGVDVHIAITTDGSAGSVIEDYKDKIDQLVAIRAVELDAAIDVLGATLHKLNYRDSGYAGDPSNHHPDAFINVDEQLAIGRLVKLIREIRPQVVITNDETGTDGHPDHIFCGKITTAAFHAAGDANQYPEYQMVPYQPQRLYYVALSNKWIKIIIRIMQLRGLDPTKFGRNKDVDLTKAGVSPQKIHTHIDFGQYWDVKREASSHHASQGGGVSVARLVPSWLLRRFLGKETYTRAFPPTPDGYRENDLFLGVSVEA